MEAQASRDTCEACRRPSAYCYCALLPRLAPRTRVVFLQHPRERDVAIGTARMAHLALAGSRLIEGVHLDAHPALCPLFEEEGVAVLFPSDDARPLEDWLEEPPRTLVVIDGTWSQAKKLLSENPRLAGLPRVSYRPPAPGNYRIRKEPAENCLATIEAVSAVLGVLEGSPDRFATMLEPFRFMVDRQLEAAAVHKPRRRRRRREPAPLVELSPLLAAPRRGVVVYAEANCHSRHERAPGAPELLHLVAARPAVGERFEAVLRPRRPLSSAAPERLGLSLDALLTGENVESALARFRAFLGDDALLCAWGAYPRDLLAREGDGQRGFIDLRALAARALSGSPGGIELGAQRLEVPPPAAAPTRAGRMLGLLEGVLASLSTRASLSIAA